MRSLASPPSETGQRSSRLFLYFALGMMIISSVGYAFLSSPAGTDPAPTGSTPAGIQSQGNGVWTADIYGSTFQFLTDPTVVGTVSLETNLTLSELASTSLEYDILSPGLAQALGGTLGQLVPSQPVCVGTCTEDVPERDCTTPVIIWNQTALVNRVYQTDQCVIIEGNRTAFDAWIYRLTGLA